MVAPSMTMITLKRKISPLEVLGTGGDPYIVKLMARQAITKRTSESNRCRDFA